MTDPNTTMHGFELLKPHPSPQLLPAGALLGPVHLDVTDGANSRLFWTRYIGLELIREGEDEITLGVSGTPMIVLHPGANSPVVPRHTGLYHVAIHVPEQKELARIAARLYGFGWEHSPTDHTETMATYTSDPDGNGIEITFETPERGSLGRRDNEFAAVLADGTIRSGTEALDVDMLLSTLRDDDDLMASMAPGSRIGHVHLHVNDMAATREFYIQHLGFGDMRAMERFGMSDFSLLTSFVPHALAVNTWNGHGARPRPEGSSGLRSWTLIVNAAGDLFDISQRLQTAEIEHEVTASHLLVRDPAENLLTITPGESA